MSLTIPIDAIAATPSAKSDAAVPRGQPVTSALSRAAQNVGLGAIGFAILTGIWALISWRTPAIPSPAATFTQLRELLEDPFRDGAGDDKGIAIQLRGSLQRVFTGFGMAVVAGVPLGLLIGASKTAWRVANPVIQLLRPVSPLAWFPIWLTMFRDAPQAAVWVIFLTALWPVAINTAAGASSVPKDQRNVARVFKFGRIHYLRHVLVPHSLPSIVTGLRLSMGIAWMVIVAVEMLAGGQGIGSFIWYEYNALNLANVICAVGIIGTIGLVLDAAFLWLGRRVEHAEVLS